MILTTSRKPGRKTRRLARTLARYMNWDYVQRGKLNVESSASGNFAVLQEIKGNPAILRVFKNNKEVLSLRFSISEIYKIKIGADPVVFVGKVGFNPLLLEAVPHIRAGAKFAMKFKSKKKIYVKRIGKIIIFNFTYDDKTIMKMKCYESGVRIQDS